MGEGRIKTAIELAMEKIADMPKLDSSEMKKQQEEKLHSDGFDIVQKYINFPSKKHDFEKELRNFKSEEEAVVKKGMIDAFCQFLSMTDSNRNSAILDATIQVFPKCSLDKVEEKLDSLQADFRETLNKAYKVLEEEERKKLESWGVSGSAVHPNALITEEWREITAEIEGKFARSFESVTAEFKQKVTQS